LLKKYDAKATFFLISNNIKGREGVVERIVAEGHEIGNPSLHYTTRNFEKLFLESNQILCGFQSDLRWFRPGSGLFSRRMLNTVIEKHKCALALGSIYPHDPQIRSPMLNSLFLRLRSRPGGVIIVHDRPWTLMTLHKSLPELKIQGLKLTTLSQMDSLAGSKRR
jgi:peptidoglycan/xylan/chitin deacetylase (PgdA/CDA1 family)